MLKIDDFFRLVRSVRFLNAVSDFIGVCLATSLEKCLRMTTISSMSAEHFRICLTGALKGFIPVLHCQGPAGNAFNQNVFAVFLRNSFSFTFLFTFHLGFDTYNTPCINAVEAWLNTILPFAMWQKYQADWLYFSINLKAILLTPLWEASVLLRQESKSITTFFPVAAELHIKSFHRHRKTFCKGQSLFLICRLYWHNSEWKINPRIQ